MSSCDWHFVQSHVRFIPKGSAKPVKVQPKAKQVGVTYCMIPGKSPRVCLRILGLVRKDCSFQHFHIKKVDCSRFRENVVSISFKNGDVVFFENCLNFVWIVHGLCLDFV